MRIAVGTTREPKLAGTRDALARLATLPWPPEPVEIVAVDASSGEADTPLSEAATLAGARRRARVARASVPGAAFGVGLEGGVTLVSRDPLQVVLRNWAAVWDGKSEAVGAGPAIMLPGELAEEVLSGVDLATAIDRWSGQHDVRSHQGAFGVLTRDLIPRSQAFSLAVVAAFAPWYKGE
jgi:inosine/xanthosine triphosphatase